MQYNLDQSAVVQGLIKPGANIEEIVSFSSKNIGNFTKKDIVVLCGGTQDVGKNETNKGIHKLKHFIDSHSHTNFIVLGVPHRHDLDLNSCVNNEVKVFNRKLKKRLKLCTNTQIVDIDSSRDLYTRHGLHLNSKGKEQTVKEIVKTIKCILNKKMSDPIILPDRNDGNTSNITTEKTTEPTQSQDVEVQPTNENLTACSLAPSVNKLPSKRARRPPNTRHSDFLWPDI